MDTSGPLKLATVEDDPRYRRSLLCLLGTLREFDVVASFISAEPLLACAHEAHRNGSAAPWDLVLTDLNLPGIDGAVLTRELKGLFPELRVVVLTVFDEPARVLAAICAGADGYLLKSSSNQDLIEQLGRIIQGGAPLSSELAGTLLKLGRERVDGSPRQPAAPPDLGLTPRQLDVLRCLTRGFSYREIGEHLHVSVDTVRSHIRQIYAALRVHNVVEAVNWAIRHRLI